MRACLTHVIHHFRGMENMYINNKFPKDKDFFLKIILEENTNEILKRGEKYGF